MLCSLTVWWGESTLAVTLLALNSWTCKRSARVLTIGKDLLRNLVILSFVTLQAWFLADLPTIPSVFMGPEFLPGLRRESSGFFQPRRWEWVPPWLSWALLSYYQWLVYSWAMTLIGWGPLEWDGLLRLLDPFSPSRGIKSDTNEAWMERWKALWSSVAQN